MHSPTVILNSIRMIVRALRVSSRATEKELGLSGAQLFVLQKLQSGEALSINELAQRTLTHQSSVSVVVTRLFEQGLVLRTPDEKDARRLKIVLSNKGRELLRKAPGKLSVMPQERLINAISSLSSAQQTQLAKLLETIVQGSGFEQEPIQLFFEEDERKKTLKNTKK